MNTKIKFWIRAIVWAIFAYLLPIGLLVWKFNLFQVTTKVTVGGIAGIICIIVAFGFFNTVSKYVEEGTTDVMVKQCVSGLRKKILPLFITWFILYLLRGDIELFVDVLGAIIVSEAISIPINPFPLWIKENQTEEQKKVIDSFFKKITKALWRN